MSERDELLRQALIKRAKEKHAAESSAPQERGFFDWSPETQLEAFKNQGKSALHGVNNMLSGGLYDEGVAKSRELIDGADYQTERDAIRASIANDVDKSPGGFIGGSLLAAPVVGMVPGANTVLGSAAMGGVSSYGNTNSDDPTDQIINTTVGTVLGGTGGLLAKGAQNAGNITDTLAEKSFHAPKGAYDYHGAQGMRDLGRQALDDGMMNPFNTAEDNLNLATQNLSRTGAQKTDAVRNGAPVDMHRVLNQAKQRVSSNPQLQSQQIKGVKGALDEIEVGRQGLANRGFEAQPMPTLDGPRVQNYVPASVADELKMAVDDMPKWDLEGNAIAGRPYIKQYSNTLREAVEEVNPNVAPLNQTYQRQLGVQELAKDYLGKQNARGIFKGTVEGVRNSGLKIGAIGMDKVDQIMRMDPKLFGKYEGPLTSAIRRSPNSAAAYLHVLNQDPEFREHIRQLEEQGY